MLPVVDEVVDGLQGQLGGTGFVRAEYPDNPALAQAAERDNAGIRAALQALGIPLDIPDPAAQALLRSSRPVSTAVAAAELGIAPAQSARSAPNPRNPASPFSEWIARRLRST